MSEIESPCILVCSFELSSGHCFGCGRTREEVATWPTMTQDERRTVMALLPARLQKVTRPPRRETRRARMARERGESA